MPGGQQWFQSTHWSVVLQAQENFSDEGAAALAKLCENYWYPLYAYVRRKGHSPDDAMDLTQEFFGRLLAKNYLLQADRQKGKFRSFLLAHLEHFLAKEWTRAHRQKRGGGQALLSLDAQNAETRYAFEPPDKTTPAELFERRWALALLEQTMILLRNDYQDAGRGLLFQECKGLLSGDPLDASYADLAAKLAMSEGALKVAIHRMRKRYGELLREQIGLTVANPAHVDEELRSLFAALRK